MNDIIDLHVHSYVSDGTFSPKEVIEEASKAGIKAISLTDHDSIEGVPEAEAAAKVLNIDFLKGIEISSSYVNGKLLHILGLGIDTENEDFQKAYTKMKIAREQSIPDILNFIADKGIPIDIEELKAKAINKHLDRYDIHKYFLRKGFCNSSQEIWDKYLDPVPYGKDEILSAEEAIDIIHKAGGLSFLAHYNKKIGLSGFTKEQMDEHIKYLVSVGLNGIERYYPSYTDDAIEHLVELINKYSLLISGGTDFHGKNRPDINLGIGNGNLSISYTVYKNIINKLNNR